MTYACLSLFDQIQLLVLEMNAVRQNSVVPKEFEHIVNTSITPRFGE